jgi:hypothetical protein
MEKLTIIKSLNLFNEKARRLESLSFVEAVTQGYGVTIAGDTDKGGTYKNQGPNDEAIDAFVLTFRFFIQDNEKISFRNMARIYQSHLIDEGYRNRFMEVRNDINSFLDSDTHINWKKVNKQGVLVDSEVLTHRRIMDIFIYGGLSHANEQKKREYDSLLSFKPSAVVCNYEFVRTICEILRAIVYVRQLNEQVMAQLSSN